MEINASSSFILLKKAEMERWGGGVFWKINIHLNHKSELSQRLQGGEIIISLVLDYILHGAKARLALQTCLAL